MGSGACAELDVHNTASAHSRNLLAEYLKSLIVRSRTMKERSGCQKSRMLLDSMMALVERVSSSRNCGRDASRLPLFVQIKKERTAPAARKREVSVAAVASCS